MAKDKTMFVCENCGQESAKWIGKCPSCGQWNTFKEIKVKPAAGPSRSEGGWKGGGGISSRGRDAAKVLRLKDIAAHDDPRIDMHDAELNRVLGGGLVPGSIVLLGGEPGIGKSTLTLQTMLNLTDKRVLYVSGEESAHQLKMRAERILRGSPDHFLILCENSLEAIFEHIKEVQPELVVIDSIQTISTEDVESSAGSIAQVRECASALLRFAKSSAVPVILIGHITKEGTLAGPKILEHIVDTVIKQMMVDFRGAKAPKDIAGSKIVLTKDFQALTATDGEGNVTKLEMPATSNVLQWFCADGTKVSVRPSGTEPKIKFYVEVKGQIGCADCYPGAVAEAQKKVEAIKVSLGL